MTDADLVLLAGRLKNVMLQDIHQEGDCYEIRSLYFDDAWDRCMDENEAGVDKREKYRIRIYNPRKEEFHLEIKEKNNGVIIFLNHNTAIRLYKDAFVEGSWEECKEKINAMRK